MLTKLRHALVQSAEGRNLAIDAVMRHGSRAADLLVSKLSDPNLDDADRVVMARAVPIARALASAPGRHPTGAPGEPATPRSPQRSFPTSPHRD